MLYDKLRELKDYVLLKNTYFNNGFSYVYQDQGIWTDEDDKTAVFPADDLGNYFYFRLPNDISLVSSAEFRLDDCTTPVAATAQIVLVACVRGANNDLLAKNIINTFQTAPIYAKTFTSAILMKEKVVRQELSFLTGESLQAALQRIPKDYSIISINFTITQPIMLNSCIVNPCSC